MGLGRAEAHCCRRVAVVAVRRLTASDLVADSKGTSTLVQLIFLSSTDRN